MPSTSKKQHNFMNAVAHNPAFAKKAGVPQSVGKDFSTADKGRKFSKGGDMAESKAMAAKEMNFMKKKGAPKSMIKHEKAEAGMKKGGMPMKMKDGKKVPIFMNKGGSMPEALAKHAAKPASKAHAGLKAGGMAYAKGGGIESKGKTKGKMIKMNSGGRAC
jgi:hypothetical protein